DFIDPTASELFAKIRQLGAEPCRIAEILQHAATGDPATVPGLLDLVSVKSTLPAWMTAPLDLELKTKTREVSEGGPALARKDSRWLPWQARLPSSSVP